MSESQHAGYATPSATFDPRDQGTNWPPDSFTRLVMEERADGLATPAAHSYDGDGNMESFSIAGPYSARNEAETDVGAFTGATGTSGHATSSQ